MNNITQYQIRPIRFIGLENFEEWTFKVYSISCRLEKANQLWIDSAINQFPIWIRNVNNTNKKNYRVATLIVHEGREGCFAIISCWVDENMLQLFAYFAGDIQKVDFQLISDKGLVSCVWELAILWFERNAWVNLVMQDPDNPLALQNYLQQQLNEDI